MYDNITKYYRLGMNYNTYNFSDLKKEYKKGEIKWLIKAKCSSLEEEHLLFIYCNNMPDKVNRFIMKAKIKELKPRDSSNEKIFKDSNAEDYNTLMVLDEISAFSDEKKEELSTSKIETFENYGGFNGTYGEIKNKKLINLLNNYKCMDINELLEKYIDCHCYFKGVEINSDKDYSHPTFIKDNGSTYVEFHHFIFRSLCYKKNDKELEKELDREYNNTRLCPSCHRMIYYGNIETRKKMVDYI